MSPSMFSVSNTFLWAISLAASAGILRSYFAFGASHWPHFRAHATSDVSLIVITALVSNLVLSYAFGRYLIHPDKVNAMLRWARDRGFDSRDLNARYGLDLTGGPLRRLCCGAMPSEAIRKADENCVVSPLSSIGPGPIPSAFEMVSSLAPYGVPFKKIRRLALLYRNAGVDEAWLLETFRYYRPKVQDRIKQSKTKRPHATQIRSGLRRDEPAVRGLRIIGLEKSMQEWMTRTFDRSSSGTTLQESDQPSPSTNRSTSSTLFTPPSCPTSSPDTPYLMMKPLSTEKRRRAALNDVQ